jgi:hypothetical protein
MNDSSSYGSDEDGVMCHFSGFRLKCRTQWAVYIKEEIYLMYISLETIRGKEISSFKVGSRRLDFLLEFSPTC